MLAVVAVGVDLPVTSFPRLCTRRIASHAAFAVALTGIFSDCSEVCSGRVQIQTVGFEKQKWSVH